MKIGFIGCGIMGSRMAARLLDAGHAVCVYARTSAKAAPLLARGAALAQTPEAAANDAECVITMVGGPADVKDLYFDHLLDVAPRGALLIDSTTSSPRLAERIFEAAARRGLAALDAPVTGGPPGAESGTLAIMAGGSPADFDRARPVLSALGSDALHFGAAGNGQRAKLVNQIVGMQNVLAAIEGLFLARRIGLDGELALQLLQNGMADSKSLRNSGTRAMRGDFTPNFSPVHVIKDLTLAIEEADAHGLDLPGLRTAHRQWQTLIERYPEARAVQEIARLYL